MKADDDAFVALLYSDYQGCGVRHEELGGFGLTHPYENLVSTLKHEEQAAFVQSHCWHSSFDAGEAGAWDRLRDPV